MKNFFQGMMTNTGVLGEVLVRDLGQETPEQKEILQQLPLQRIGHPQDIANTILYLLTTDYVNGQIIAVDGGRQLF